MFSEKLHCTVLTQVITGPRLSIPVRMAVVEESYYQLTKQALASKATELLEYPHL